MPVQNIEFSSPHRKKEVTQVDGARNKMFVIKILNNQNATWQGTITWTDTSKTESFRSALELIKLIDNAVLSD